MFDAVDAAYKDLVKVLCPDTNLPALCQFLIDIRSFHNVSIEEFAQILGITIKQVLEIEQGNIWGNITPSALSKLENYFNLKKGCLKNYLKESYITS